MTETENAIAYLQEQCCHNSLSHKALGYNLKAILALHKQIPMLVSHERTFWTYRHYCPECLEQLKIECLKYCNHCGQRLDWSNYELGLKYVR